ncbi:MAG: gliding motility-associated C-terminal domain-containing protein, partial [Bacteroidales bacterium]|nr:gliding motility-associated C-terminal domain-containing protein [Bacteroidales bacterium]
YTFTWTEVNGTCTDNDNVLVDYLETPVANAGTGGDACGFDFDLNAVPSVGTGTWTYAGPGLAVFAPNTNTSNATVTVDTYGSYTFTWTEVNGICSDNDNITVNFYEQPIADAGSGGDECDFDFVLSAVPSVGTGTWTFTGPGLAVFAPNANTSNATVTVDTYGSYDFTWTEDNSGCTDADLVTVNFYEQPVADAGSGGDECNLDFDLNAVPSAGTGTWTYAGPGLAGFAPNVNDPNATVTVDTYGSYNFTWTEDNGSCTDADMITVNFYEQPIADAGSGGDECDFDFVLSAVPSVGTGTWTFTGPGLAVFAPNANTSNATVTVDTYGSYDFTWTEDNSGCTDADIITVNFYEQPVANAGAGGSVCGFSFGLGATPSVGTGTWTYTGPGTVTFAPNANDPNATATADIYGSYTFTWTEVNGTCTDNDNVIVDYIEGPTAYAGTDSVLCFGTPYYIADADTTNSDGVTWEILTGNGSLDITNIIDPEYTPDVTDGGIIVELVIHASGNGPCIDATDTIRLTYLSELIVSIGKPSPFLIDSVTAGTPTHIDVYVKIAGHDYTKTIGVYLVSPLDSVVELKPACAAVFGPSWLTDATYKFYNDAEDTSAVAVIDECAAASGRYEFSGEWKNKLHGQDPANGAWRVRITDTHPWGSPGKLEEATITFSDYNASAVFESVLYADSSISLDINGYGGSGPYAITEYTLPITGLTTSCFGVCDAKAISTASGGQGPYTFEWSTSLDFSTIYDTNDTVDLCAGKYYVKVTDSHGCIDIDSIIVGEPDEIVITDSYVENVSCNGGTTGKIMLKFSGGSGSLQYSHNLTDWYNSGDTIKNLIPDTYTLTIRDLLLGCEIETEITVNEPGAIDANFSVNQISCFGFTDGEITSTPLNGTAPYDFEWSTGDTDLGVNSSTISGLIAGTYTVTITDANSCVLIDDTLILAEPSALNISGNIRDKRCIACDSRDLAKSSGRIIVVVGGGTSPFNYNWTGPAGFTPENNDTITNLQIGAYNLTVTDFGGCSSTYGANVSEDNSFDILSYDVDFADESVCWNDSVEITSTYSGTADTMFLQIFNTDNLTALSRYITISESPLVTNQQIEGNSNFQIIRVTNDYCKAEVKNIPISYFPDFELDIIDGIDDNADDDTIYLKGASSGQLSAYVVDNAGISFAWTPEESLSIPSAQTTVVSPDSSGWYQVIATSTDDCVDTSRIYLEFIPVITPNDGFSPNDDGINDYWRIKHIEKFRNNVVTIYSRWGIKVFEQKGYDNNDLSKVWNGKAKNGKDLGSGTYYYVIILNEEGFQPITGPVTIIR